MDNNVTTWADGFGRWHADVPDTPRGYTKAANAIAHELASRSPWNYSEALAYVETNIVSIPSDKPGRVHFAEYAID